VSFFGVRATFLLLPLLIAACSPPQQPPISTTDAVSSHTKPTTPVSEKIAWSIRSVAQRMRQDGITAANVATRQAESYTTPLVRVDHAGRLHAVILVTMVDDQVEAVLEEHQVRIEIADASLRMIQTWIPFDRLEHIAALPFVRYIQPPSYAVRR
jgi:asparagine synthetase B (glutamine-hydrolysing)